MKIKIFTFLFLGCLPFLAFGQGNKVAQVKKSQNGAVEYTKVNMTGAEENANIPASTVGQRGPLCDSDPRCIGSTWYDLQTNGSTMNRIVLKSDGTISGSWTRSSDASWGDRGTGYNHWDGAAWGADPIARLEAPDVAANDNRTGWPSLTNSASDQEYVVTHFSPNTQGLKLIKNNNDGTWTESVIPSANQMLWPRSAVGGPNGETLHAFGITMPVANGGVEVNGQDGSILYFRSQDGGDTWDIQDYLIPGLDANNFLTASADGYSMDANGNTIAFAIFNDWADVVVVKSEDNGTTWTKHIINDFPVDLLDLDTYEIADLDFDGDGEVDEFETSDNSGTVLVDDDGTVHVWYGAMTVTDDVAGGNTSYFPGTNGLHYWTEDFGPDSTQIITGALDLNGDDSLALDYDGDGAIDIGTYFTSLSSFPNAGLGADGTLYLAYSAVVESFNNFAQFYRHTYVMKSPDGGTTWGDPLDITEFTTLDPVLLEFTESVMPGVTPQVGDFMSVLVQEDFEPGLAVRGDEDTPEENIMIYAAIPIEDIPLPEGWINVENIPTQAWEISISPNPASSNITLEFTLPEAKDLSINLYNMLGQKVKNFANQKFALGNHVGQFDIQDLPKGMYIIRLESTDVATSQKILID